MRRRRPASRYSYRQTAAVTATLTVQSPRLGIAAPVKVTVELPAAAVSVPPVQVVPALPTTTTPWAIGL